MGENAIRLLKFLLKYYNPNGWHTIGPDARRAGNRLVELGFAEWA